MNQVYHVIKFLGQEDGQEVCEVVDYSREAKGPHRLTFRPIRDGESLTVYFDRIMNKYWWETGKNKRKYHELE